MLIYHDKKKIVKHDGGVHGFRTVHGPGKTPTSVGAGHLNDVHPPDDVFFLDVFIPPKHQSLNYIMSKYYTNLKYRIKDAIDAVNDGDYKFASTAAQTFNISVRTLQKRLAETHISLFER